MPGVAVLPNTPGLGGFGSSHSTAQNGHPRLQDDMTVAEIKSKAIDAVQKETRGASPMSLIKIARNQYFNAKDYESKGDLKNSLDAFIKAASLAKMTIDSHEFATGKGGVLWKEVSEFQRDTSDLGTRMNTIEEKLRVLEKPPSTPNGRFQDDSKPASIADRLRLLQDKGMSVSTSKRFSRDLSNLPTPPTSPIRSSVSQSSPPSTLLSVIAPTTPVSSAPSPHTLVLPSSLGPPSPSSSPPSSPQSKDPHLSEHTQNFPTIEELNESFATMLSSIPTGTSVGSDHSSTKDYRIGDSAVSPLAFKNFTVPIERPSSTPITPTVNVFASRPASPTKFSIPHKPSGLSGNASPSIPPHIGRPSLPVTNTAFPHELLSYLHDHTVLLLDVRNRSDFDREHIRADAVVCIEPSVLTRGSVNADMLQDSMVIAPRQEQTVFGNRDKFDLVVVYDQSSTSFGSSDSPLSVLVRAISEQAFKKILKRMPMMLVGGIDAWQREIGDTELIRGTVSIPEPRKRSPGTASPAPVICPNPRNPFMLNGLAGSSSSSSMALSANDAYPPSPRLGVENIQSATDTRSPRIEHRSQYSLDHSGHTRSPAETTRNPSPERSLIRKPAIIRPSSQSISYSRSSENGASSSTSGQSVVNTTINTSSSISYPQFPRRLSPTASGSGSQFVSPPSLASPPQASINPSHLSRRRSDYVDQSQEALSGLSGRPSIDYPELSTQHLLRLPPVAASPVLERQDNRPRLQHGTSAFPGAPSGPKPPRIGSDYPVTYWTDVQIGTSGLKNLGNTCYMNAPIQCLSATVPFARFFTDGRWKNAINYTNPLGSKGRLAGAFAKLVHEMWGGDLPYLTPIDFRRSICQLKSQYNGSDQHDSQEFLSFLIDGIHEDLNRVMIKPVWAPTPEQEAELERLPPQIASDREWRAWRERNDSLIVDYFQGQFRNRLECLTCHKTSTTYNVFSILQLPIPHGRNGKVPIQRCLDAFFNTEVLEKDDAWDCPQCKVKRRASKQLSLARLPPILLIHLKRFEANGRFSDKIDTFVDFPVKSLDLTSYMPPPLPPGVDKGNADLQTSPEDPRTQIPPYRYDLYGVTNHYGNLSSGHYTAFIASRGGWMYCDDSSVKAVDPKQVVGQKAYVLFYKRTRP